MTAVLVGGAPTDRSNDVIPLGRRLDDIRPIVPVPEAAGRPDMARSRGAPACTWAVVDATDRSMGFLCVYVSNGIETIDLWIYGQYRGREPKWCGKRVPEFNSAIATHNLKDKPDAIIVALDARQTSDQRLPDRDGGRERVWVLVSFDRSIPKRTSASARSSGAHRSIALGGAPSSNPAPRVAPVESEETSKSHHAELDRQRPGGLGSSATKPQQDDRVAADTKKPARASLETDYGTTPVASDGHQHPPTGQMVTVRAADVEPQAISWLWPGRIPGGKVTMIVGNPGVSKSLLAVHLTATVSRGALWPGTADPAPQGSVLVVSTEDDASDTIVPRLRAADADMAAVYLFREVADHNGRRSLDLTRDMATLEQKAAEVGDLKLIIIDPITACLGRANQNAAGHIRAVLTGLVDFAARTGIAVVVISHLNKGSSRLAMMRITGSLAFVAVVRAAFLLIKNPADASQRLLLPIKNNLGVDCHGLSFRVESVSTGTGMAPRLVFDSEPVVITADEALGESRSDQNSRPTLEESKEFLRDYLVEGARPASDVQAAAKAAGISMASLRRAKSDLGITPTKVGMAGEWRWILPERPKVIRAAEGAHSNTMSTFGDDEHLRAEEANSSLHLKTDEDEQGDTTQQH